MRRRAQSLLEMRWTASDASELSGAADEERDVVVRFSSPPSCGLLRARVSLALMTEVSFGNCEPLCTASLSKI